MLIRICIGNVDPDAGLIKGKFQRNEFYLKKYSSVGNPYPEDLGVFKIRDCALNPDSFQERTLAISIRKNTNPPVEPLAAYFDF